MERKNTRIQSVMLAVAAAVLIGFAVYSMVGSRSESAGNAVKNIRADVERNLASADSNARRFVEAAHRTVTAEKAEIITCKLTTTDGSSELKDDLSNLKQMDIEIRVTWSGWLHKHGNSVVAYSLVPGKDGSPQASPMKIVSTTALYTNSDCR